MPLPLLAVAGAGLLAKGIGAAGNYFAGKRSEEAAKDAARATEATQRESLAMQREMFGKGEKALNPYIDTGTKASNDYYSLLRGTTQPIMNYQQKDFNFDVNKDPAAEFRMQRAMKALQGSALAKGKGLGGGFAKALSNEQQTLASAEYDNAFKRWNEESKLRYTQASDQYNRDAGFQKDTFDRYGNLISTGAGAAGALMGGANTSAENQATAYNNIGEAQAAGITGAANARNKMWEGIINPLTQGIGSLAGNNALWDKFGSTEAPSAEESKKNAAKSTSGIVVS